mgnify:CR=1 FL=1
MLFLRKSLPSSRDWCAWLRWFRAIGIGNGKKDVELLAPITTKPWGKFIPKLAEVAGPTDSMRNSQLLYNEPKYVRMDDGGLHTLESNGLKMKQGVFY